MNKRTVQITREYDFIDTPHLENLSTCTHCSKSFGFRSWINNTVIFMPIEKHCKILCGVFICECQNCFEKMWVHIELLDVCMYKLPQNVIAEAKHEHKCRLNQIKAQINE